MEKSNKRRRVEKREAEEGTDSSSAIVHLIETSKWQQATSWVQENQKLIASLSNPSPLAVACRCGAPVDLIRALLKAAPRKVRDLLDSRGTPLHEAIVCENTGVQVIDALLKVDEELSGEDARRATLQQDVDGFTPLHLLIRRRFQNQILQSGEDTGLMRILERLVVSCPEAVVVPDSSEYEEPPIVYAIKANVYAPSLGSEEETLCRVEMQIFEMVQCMLKYCPEAASRVFKGYRGQYTALHSAVFHGRYTNTIQLLLETGARHPSSQSPALLGNTQGELPLHFCAMRGERPRSIALIAKAAPQAVLHRDASGLTPFHWLWIRFVSTLLALDDSGRGEETTIPLDRTLTPPFETNRYNEYWCLEQGDFERDLQLLTRMDPPVDFLRMRHIPSEVQDDAESSRWAARSVEILKRTREAHHDVTSNQSAIWSRREVVTALFWTKVVSLLEAAQTALGENSPRGPSILLHTALASPCCVPAISRVAAGLFPQELNIRDEYGRLPLHYAAKRPWLPWDWPRDDSLNEPTAANLLQREALRVLKTAMELSHPSAVRIADRDNRLVLHHVIDSFVQACRRHSRSTSMASMKEMLDLLDNLIMLHPDSLQRRDGITKLYPFLQATAISPEEKRNLQGQDELSLSISFQLLRKNPSLLSEITEQ